MIRFKTESGTIYAVDHDNKLARRESGKMATSTRLTEEVGWKEYVSISTIEVGVSVIFIWYVEDTAPLDNGHGMPYIPTTTTSQVVEILPDLN